MIYSYQNPLLYKANESDFKITNIAGNPTAYEWSSSIDGELSKQKNFSKNNLSIGTHTITLKVTNATESKIKITTLTD